LIGRCALAPRGYHRYGRIVFHDAKDRSKGFWRACRYCDEISNYVMTQLPSGRMLTRKVSVENVNSQTQNVVVEDVNTETGEMKP
jgi:hypothetical protein